MKSILIASQDQDVFETIRNCLQNSGQTVHVSTREEVKEVLSRYPIEFLFIDMDMITPPSEHEDYKDQLRSFWKILPDIEIIILCNAQNTREAVQVVKAGASSYLTYPIKPTEIKLLIDNIHRDVRVFAELKYLRDRFWNRDSLPLLQTKSEKMTEVFQKIRAVSQTDTTVLLTGETGTGKGVIANLIHRHSRRNEKQFIPLHCGAIPETLLESELFGHEKGAFTGAVTRKLGKFEIAQGGTLFLDEIGTISNAMQIKLLHVLQERTLQRVGGEQIIHVDIRLIIATNSNLKVLVDEGHFRQDLFYRLNVFPIELPPLRERIEDIPVLVNNMLKKQNKFSLKQIVDVDKEVICALQAYHWPGNIRELENLIERAFVLEESPRLTPASFPAELFEGRMPGEMPAINTQEPLKDIRQKAIESIEKQYLIALLEENKGKVQTSAAQAGIGVRQMHKLMVKYGIEKNHYK